MLKKFMQRAAAFVQRLVDRSPLQSRTAAVRQQQQLQELKGELDDLNVTVQQLSLTINDLGGLLPPPLKLQRRVVGPRFDLFTEGGLSTVKDFDRILAPTGRSLSSFKRILDFGAGCARILKPLRSYVGPDPELYGTDIDAEAIDWCRQNYPALAVFETNEVRPPLSHESDSFDFVYCVSVFTHLPEDMQFMWLRELNRIVKPEGYLILSIHGEFFHDRISSQRCHELETEGFLHFNNGLTEGLPDFYLTTFHTHDYVRRRWANHLEIISIEARGIIGRQDAVLCRKKDVKEPNQ